MAATVLKHPSSPCTRGVASKTGIAVALPYRGTHRCIYLVGNYTSSLACCRDFWKKNVTIYFVQVFYV